MNTREILKAAAAELRSAGVPDPEYDSGMLLSHVMKVPYLELRLGAGPEPTAAQEEEFRRLAAARKAREPLQYLLGTVFFRGTEFLIRPGALIPRPETELLADWAEEKMRGRPRPEILDLCCGSGCIGLSLKKAVPEARVLLTDLSPEAVRLTEENRRRLFGENPRGCEIRQGDLLAPAGDRKFDCIVSNPPYIPSAECENLQAEVLKEPRTALDGGTDGMDFYRRIAAGAPERLKAGGCVLLEVGIREAEPVAGMLREAGAARTEIRRDDAGVERMVLAEFA